MNRIIKFRVWDKEERCFNSDYSINGDYVYGYCEGRQIPAEEQYKLVFMQFTGLLDKNGKEIYESDIVKNNDHIWRIIFKEGAYYIDNLKDGGKWIILGEEQHCEIIGNIYESPELLTP